MKSPPYLNAGDKVKIISTARKINKDVIEGAASIISSWGLNVEFGDNLFKEDNQYAGSDTQRLQDLQHALDDPDIKAIFCSRGGYGTLRIIDEISFDKFNLLPKWLIGYSDITVIHCHLQHVWQVESLHGSMPVNFIENTRDSLQLMQLTLFGSELEYSVQAHNFNRQGKAEAELIGGNLSILYSLNGSVSMPDMTDKILFIEDLDEYLYHIDRMMMNLKRSNCFENLAGMVVGHLSDMNDNEIPFGKTAYNIVRDAVSDYNFPVCFGFPAGHANDNMPLILGRKLFLSVTEDDVSLKFSS